MILTDLPQHKGDLVQVARKASQAGAQRAFVHAVDYSNMTQVDEAARSVLSTNGAVDVLVLMSPRSALGFTYAAASLLKSFLPRMCDAGRGCVIAVLKPQEDEIRWMLEDAVRVRSFMYGQSTCRSHEATHRGAGNQTRSL